MIMPKKDQLKMGIVRSYPQEGVFCRKRAERIMAAAHPTPLSTEIASKGQFF